MNTSRSYGIYPFGTYDRKTNTNTYVPCPSNKLRPKWPRHDMVRAQHEKTKENQAFFFNRRHAAQSLPVLTAGDKVRIKLDSEKRWEKQGTVLNGDPENRTYTVKTKDGIYRRNRVHLQKIPEQTDQEIAQPNQLRNFAAKSSHSNVRTT